MKKSILCIATVFIMIVAIFGAGCITEKVDYDEAAQSDYELTLEMIENTPSEYTLLEGYAHVLEALNADISAGTNVVMVDVTLPNNEMFFYTYYLGYATMVPIKNGVKFEDDTGHSLFMTKKEGVGYNYMFMLADPETKVPTTSIIELTPEYYDLMTGLAASYLNKKQAE